MVIAIIFVYPYYQYAVDPDATSYLAIAARYVSGDFEKAINGYWSPWAIWLTALVMKAGFAGFLSAIIVNTAAAIGFLYISHSLFLFFNIEKFVRYILCVALVVFLVYAIFWQSFDDLWECFFLLSALRVMLSGNFSKRPALWLLTGVLGALAYFSKAYAFPFFILNIICCSYFIAGANRREDRKKWLTICMVTIGTMFLVSFPWIYLLHQKYHTWTTGTAGSLNLSWYLVGHPYWKEGISVLLPPVYNDSVYYWEDPWFVNGPAPIFLSSVKLFFLQLIKIAYNFLKLIQSMNELSAFFAFIALITIGIVFSRRIRIFFSGRVLIIAFSFLLFPLGYLLINYQGRYLWYMLPLSMIIGIIAFTRMKIFQELSRRFRLVFVLLFAGSFIVYPIIGLKDMFLLGKKEFVLAQKLKEEKIQGSFTTNIPYSEKTQHIVRLAWFSGSPYYNMPVPAEKSALLSDIRRYGIKYYFHFSEWYGEDFRFTDENGQPFPEIAAGKLPGLKVFQIHPY
jgi:hypothetical protein